MPDQPRPRPDDPAVIPTDRLRQPQPGVIDQRQQQIDPAGRHRIDRDVRPDTNRKQPGGHRLPGQRAGPPSEPEGDPR